MTGSLLRVGIPARLTGPYAPVPPRVIEALVRNGFEPVVLDGTDPFVDAFDALLLTGGPTPLSGTERSRADPYAHDEERDRRERNALHLALETGRPALGICRGAQIMALEAGGALHRLSSPSVEQHRGSAPGAPRKPASHPVALQPASRLATLVGTSLLPHCPSHHTYGIDAAGSANLTEVGWAPDGSIEAIEMTGHRAVGVMWHPEDAPAEDRVQQAVFRALKPLGHEYPVDR